MDPTTLVTISAGLAIALLVAGVASMLVKSDGAKAEERLASLTTGRQSRTAGQRRRAADSLLRAPPINAEQMALLSRLLPSPEGLRRLYEQADVGLGFGTFLAVAGGLAGTGLLVGLLTMPPLLAPVVAAAAGALPFLFLVRRKARRIALFMAAMPDAVELMSRALRAGHGLASGMQLVAQETRGPIAAEFGRVFEEQNLGVPLDDSLRGMAERVPTMDVRFLVTAIIIQRTTGGDLAEILDKIGRLIRQRFELKGQVKALTAEGRLSGMVLMALPPGLLAFLGASNPEYVAPLFNTPLGTKLLAATAVCQVLGALAIKKVVSIKV